jgi:hypothetical protein
VTGINPATGSNVHYSANQIVRITYEYTSPYDGDVLVQAFLDDGTLVPMAEREQGDMYPSSNCTEGDGVCATNGLGQMGESFVNVSCKEGNQDSFVPFEDCTETFTTMQFLLRLYDGPGDYSAMTQGEISESTKNTHRVQHEIHWMP